MRIGGQGVERETTAQVRLRKYRPKQDFLRIRDFLSNTYRAFGEPLNWRIERWNYARYFVTPMLGAYGQKEPTREGSLKAIRCWEDTIGSLPESSLPEGYVLRSMAQENDIELRREVFGRAFNHSDPSEWPSAFSYEELQKAPDYRKDLDLYIVGPDGKYVSCCIVWYDEQNKLGVFEPVGTHPEFRRRGLGREVVLEGIRRVANLGAEKVCVGSGQRFYEAIGFKRKYVSYRWTKRF